MSSASLWTTDRSASNSASRSSVAVRAARTRSLAAVTVSLTAATSPRIERVMADTSSEITLLRSMRGLRSSSVRWSTCSSLLPAGALRRQEARAGAPADARRPEAPHRAKQGDLRGRIGHDALDPRRRRRRERDRHRGQRAGARCPHRDRGAAGRVRRASIRRPERGRGHLHLDRGRRARGRRRRGFARPAPWDKPCVR